MSDVQFSVAINTGWLGRSIDCAACEPVCPVTAIFAEDDTPPEWDKYIDLNYEYFGLAR